MTVTVSNPGWFVTSDLGPRTSPSLEKRINAPLLVTGAYAYPWAMPILYDIAYPIRGFLSGFIGQPTQGHGQGRPLFSNVFLFAAAQPQ